MPLLPFEILTASPTSQALAQSQKDREAEAHRLYQQGTQQLENEQFREASQSFQQVLQIYRELGDRTNEADMLSYIGHVYFDDLKQPSEALAYFQQALEIYQKHGDRDEEADLLENIRKIQLSLSGDASTIEMYSEAERLLRVIEKKKRLLSTPSVFC